ncbi:MAG: DUF47 family protein [Candidatus Bathyarchaeia archaeon]
MRSLGFSFTSDEQARRRILSLCQEHTRFVQDAARGVAMMWDNYTAGNHEEVQKGLEALIALNRKAKDAQRETVLALTKTGPMLLSRGDVTRLLSTLSSMTDSFEGAAYRIAALSSMGHVLVQDIGADLAQMSGAVVETTGELAKTIFTLSMNPSKAVEVRKNVNSLEERVDALYRESDLKVLKSNLPIAPILLLRDILFFLENAADLAEDAADDAQILVFSD